VNDIPREKMLSLITRFGTQIGEDPKRCEFLLRDVCGEYKKEIAVLVAAVKENIPKELISADGRIPREHQIGILAKRLHDDYGIILDLARWGVETWLIGLREQTPLRYGKSQEEAKRGEGGITSQTEITNSVGIRLRKVPLETLVFKESGVKNTTSIAKWFYLGVHQVTQQEFKRITGRNPSHFKSQKRPVESLTWEQAMKFCEELTNLPAEKFAGRSYRLPTEVEWEYACRAGSSKVFCFGDEESILNDYAWFAGNSDRETHPVEQKKPNHWGFYDMHGNVREWCQDWFEDCPIDPNGSNMSPSDPFPKKDTTSGLRVVRGGSWSDEAVHCRSAVREGILPSIRFDNIGFRVAMTIA
jgi:hypothetical protein